VVHIERVGEMEKRSIAYILNNAKFNNLVEAMTEFPGFKEVVERKGMVDSGLVRRML